MNKTGNKSMVHLARALGMKPNSQIFNNQYFQCINEAHPSMGKLLPKEELAGNILRLLRNNDGDGGLDGFCIFEYDDWLAKLADEGFEDHTSAFRATPDLEDFGASFYDEWALAVKLAGGSQASRSACGLPSQYCGS